MNLKNKVKALLSAGAMCLVSANAVFANRLAQTKVVTGTVKLIKDATAVVLIIAPILAALLIGYFLIRKSAATEQEHERWNKKISVTVISLIGIISVSVLLSALIGYYV